MSTPRKRIDWSWGPGHGPLSGVVNSAGWAFAATGVADVVDQYGPHVSPLWPLTAGVCTAVGAAVAARNAPDRVLCYRVGCWLSAGAWSAWTLGGVLWSAGTPWSTGSLGSLLAGSLLAAGVGLGFARSEDKAQQQAVAEAALLAGQEAVGGGPDQIAAAWQRRLKTVCNRTMEVVGVEVWDPPTGYTLDVDLPADGTTINDVKQYEQALATAANLPPGCAVEIKQSEVGRRSILIEVATVNAMAEEYPLADDYTAETINNPVSVGFHPDRTPAMVDLRYSCAVLVGQTDSGKSNELNVITTGLVRCTDDLVWAIDLSGNGRYPRPWVRAWKEGRAPRPAIDWVAPTADEALLMCSAAINIVNGRTAAYEKLMFEQGEDKIIVSPDLPQITIVVDEFGTLPDEVKDALVTISDTGRGAAVRVVSCALEANATYIPRAMLNQSRVRIGMRVTDEAQIQYLMDSTWRSGRIDPSNLAHKGQGVLRDGVAPMELFKGWRMAPGRIDEASIAVADLRPGLDEVSVRLADTVTITDRAGSKKYTSVYTSRWERTLPVVFPAGNSGQSTPPVAEASQTTMGRESVAEVPGLDEALSNLETARQRMAAVDPVPDPEAEPDWSIVESWLDEGVPATDGQGRKKPHPRQRMRQLVWDARADGGIGPSKVTELLHAEGYNTTRQTAAAWMREDVEAGLLAQPKGERTPYLPGQRLVDPYADGGD